MAIDREGDIVGHYTTDNLLETIRDALRAAGKSLESSAAGDLEGVDEFHTGGVRATDDLLARLAVSSETRVLDIGCGIGGAARHIAESTGAEVVGFDLTPGYVETANALSELVGMGERTRFRIGSALDMPVADAGADLATMFHVGMNVVDKPGLFREAARVLAPGGTFALFDVMRTGDGDLGFPLPWAETPDCSFVGSPEDYRDAAARAGFEPVAERNRRDFALTFFAKAAAATEERGAPPAVGIHLLMKDTAARKIRNYVAEMEAGRLAPVEMIFRRAGEPRAPRLRPAGRAPLERVGTKGEEGAVESTRDVRSATLKIADVDASRHAESRSCR